ncbi:MAG TPA: hypothetical protein VII94_00710 [Candidatus Saccharimonadales bacterium]
MNKLMKENGFLNQEGEKATSKLKSALEELLNSDAVREMSAGELMAFQSNVANMVGKSFTDHKQNKN